MVEVGPCLECGHARGPHRPDCPCSCHAVHSPDELANHPGWISNGELTGEYVRPPSKWDNEVERIAIYLYRAERNWARDARWLDAGKPVRKGYLDRAWAVASMCNFPNHSDALNRLSPLCPCDPNPETSDGPQQECPVDGDGVTFVEEVRRLESVERAAQEYALSCLCNGGTDSPELNADINTKFGVLLDAVRTNGEFRG